MSAKQKEATAAKCLSTRYEAIAAVFDQLPERFKLLSLFELAGIKDHPRTRAAVGLILNRDFKCINVGKGYERVWKKP